MFSETCRNTHVKMYVVTDIGILFNDVHLTNPVSHVCLKSQNYKWLFKEGSLQYG